MRIIRLIIISIVVLFTIITVISLFIPSQVRVSKAIQINSSEASVMDQISNPGNWRNWYPGADSSQFIYESGDIKGLMLNDTKKQSVIITGKKKDEVTAAYVSPTKKIPTGWKIISTNNSNSVTVQWYIDFHLRWYPWEKFTSFMFEKVYNPQLQQGLDSLKAFLEK